MAKTAHKTLVRLLAAAVTAASLAACGADGKTQDGAQGAQNTAQEITLLNVSYDPTRELYQAYNPIFKKAWEAEHGGKITVSQSNGGSGKQALSVMNGLQADVVTLALAGDIDAINGVKPLIDENWQQKLPQNSTPYTSTIVFLVRAGNPKNIRDWDDLIRDDVSVITPNPKTSGGARWNFLAAWAYARQNGGDAAAEKFVGRLLRNVPIMDTGARGATITFTQRGLGDVLLAWENEAYLAVREYAGQFEIITPSLSILCEPPVAVVDAVVEKKGTRAAAAAYLQGLYSKESQRLIAENFYRPTHPEIAAEYQDRFPDLKLVQIDRDFGGWKKAQQEFFADGGIFDKIYRPK